MLMIAICDDEDHMLKELEDKIRAHQNKLNAETQVSCFLNGLELLCAHQPFDVIIMDIKMAGMDGMSVIRRLREKGIRSQVIFVTSSKDYVFQAFDVDAVHYLVKPVSDRDLFYALDKAVGRCDKVDSQTVTISIGSTVQVIPFREIIFCEVIGHKLYLSTTSGRIYYYGRLDTLQSQLDDRFFRCHRSYLVNMNFVSSRDGDTVTMTNGDRVPVSRRKQQQFSQQLLSFIRSEVL